MARRNRFGNGDGNCVLYWIIGLVVVCFLFCKKKNQFGRMASMINHPPPWIKKGSPEEKDWIEKKKKRDQELKEQIIKNEQIFLKLNQHL